MANLRLPDDELDPTGVSTRRDLLRDGARMVAGASIAAQVMAATGADGAAAQTVRTVARRAAGKPGYGPLVRNPELGFSLPEGFRVVRFGKAGTLMSDGLKTPRLPRRDDDRRRAQRARRGPAQPRGRRRRPRAGQGEGLRPRRPGRRDDVAVRHHLGDVVGVLARAERHRQQLQRRADAVGHVAVVRGVDRGPGRRLREAARLRLRGAADRDHAGRPGADQGHGPLRARGVRDRPADRRRVHDRGQRRPGRRLLPLHPGGRRPAPRGRPPGDARGARTRAVRHDDGPDGRPSAARASGCRSSDPDPSDAEKHPEAVYEQGRAQGAARFVGLEGASWSGGSVYFVASEAGDDGKAARSGATRPRGPAPGRDP